MQLNYNSTHSDQNYLGRLSLFVKKNYWIFLLDLIIVIFLLAPPYNLEETKMLLLMIAVIFIRDILILRISYKHLGKFTAKGNEVIIGILKGSKFQQNDFVGWLPDIELEIRYILGIPVLYILSSNEILLKQYPIGIWTVDKMKEFIDSFYDYKKEQALWKIYKG